MPNPLVTEAGAYRLIRLAPGSYDLEFEGEVVASVVRDGRHGHHAVTWYAELLDGAGPRPAPFSESLHEFGSFDEVMRWLGHPDLAMPRAA
jgi:hypothetical protein